MTDNGGILMVDVTEDNSSWSYTDIIAIDVVIDAEDLAARFGNAEICNV